jgi:hypothetical protein
MTTTTDITTDTTIYIIAGEEPLWYAVAETPERALAEMYAAILSEKIVREMAGGEHVFKVDAGTLAECEQSTAGLRDAMQEGEKVRYVDYEQAKEMSMEIDKDEADVVAELDDALADLD